MSSARKHKQKLKVMAPKPRNPLVAPALQRKAGVHRKSRSAERQTQQVELRRQQEEG